MGRAVERLGSRSGEGQRAGIGTAVILSLQHTEGC